MNGSFRAAGGALTSAAIGVTILIAIALLDPQATAMHSDEARGDAVSSQRTESAASSRSHWIKLAQDLRQQLTRESRRQNVTIGSNHASLLGTQDQLRTDLERELERGLQQGLGDDRLQATVEAVLAKRGEGQQFESIEKRLRDLAVAIEREVQASAKLREAVGGLEPVLAVVADADRPGRFTISAHRVPLVDVLKQLDAQSDWEITTTAAAGSLVSIDVLEGVTVEQALEVLLPAAGCAAKLVGRRITVMSLAEARRLRARIGTAPAAGSQAGRS
jgi:hypothetical protein